LITIDGLRKFLVDHLFEDFQPAFLKNSDPDDWKRTNNFMVNTLIKDIIKIFGKNVTIIFDLLSLP
jgi:hypothetical protein